MKKIETEIGPHHVWRDKTKPECLHMEKGQDEEEECIEDFADFKADLEATKLYKRKRLSDYCKEHMPTEDQHKKDHCENCHSLKRLFPDSGQQEMFLLNYLLRFRDRMTTTEIFELGYFESDYENPKKTKVIYDEDKLLDPPKSYDEIFNMS